MTVSMSGLDMSFLKKPKDTRRGKYRNDKNTGEFVDIREWHRRNPQPRKRGKVACPHFMPDVDQAYGGSWKSIIDGTEISSRSNWKEHDKRNGVVNIGKDFWDKDGDDIRYTKEKMGYDPDLIGSKDVTWD